MRVEIYDPAMCCSTGVCGSEVDARLVRFAADLFWLSEQGVEVVRYNLAQEPGAFVANEQVKAALHAEGAGTLPLIMVEGRIVSRSQYPDRVALGAWAGLEVPLARPEGRSLPIINP
jgi:hypothetical protein